MAIAKSIAASCRIDVSLILELLHTADPRLEESDVETVRAAFTLRPALEQVIEAYESVRVTEATAAAFRAFLSGLVEAEA
ncbi:hypothetical protein [Burkholderia vietnamiensis]|uniref:hypothetical protein n=1 Tax=Burkholderia vietnamiensis TaxID=60552 RepID=UPI001593DF51|nr:hypothetical protein [Burkholderia vietnamiensis]